MATKATRNYGTRSRKQVIATPQSQPIPNRSEDMGQNNAGGFSFTIDKWARLERFLILGSDGGTYYVKAAELTAQNAANVFECIKEDGLRVVDRVYEISHKGRAPKNDPALFVLALCAAYMDTKRPDYSAEIRKAALDIMPQVARIGTHLFHFSEYVTNNRGVGRALRNAWAKWYNGMDIERLAMQVIKYRQRDGWTHKDVIALAHPKTDDKTRAALYRWIVDPENLTSVREVKRGKTKRASVTKYPKYTRKALPPIINAFEDVQVATEKEAIKLITDYDLPREALPTELLNSRDVWAALLEKMPMEAMIRNLGKMTSVGLVDGNLSSATKHIVEMLGNAEKLKRSRVHPMTILTALKIYAQGHGDKGSLSWKPVTKIVDALDQAFYAAFENVAPTNKNIMYALDVSGSMGSAAIADSPLTARDASAALALICAATEPNHEFVSFQQTIKPLNISPRMRLDDVIRKISGLPFGGTDCAQPMIYASAKKMKIDAFVIYTDNETWAGGIHPSQALVQYRRSFVRDARLAVVGMTATQFSIADPRDSGMLDVVGFDTATPQLLSQFIAGEL